MEKFTGKVWVLDDDIDTDIIIPTEYLALKTIRRYETVRNSVLCVRNWQDRFRKATLLLQERTLDVVLPESRRLVF